MDYRQATVEEIEAVAGQHPLLPLALDMHGCATEEERNYNLEATIARGYVGFQTLMDKFSGTASLVGSGPSIQETYKELQGDVCAINQAVGFLIEKGVIPKFAMLWDAADIVSNFAVPHPDVTYLVASRCHPSVFERLKDCKVIVWHAGGDHKINEYLSSRNIIEPMVLGGSAGITRGIFLLGALGYRNLHLFGADSSYASDGKTHAIKSLVPEKDIMVSVGDTPPCWFRTTPEWCAQVYEYRAIYAMFTHKGYAMLQVHGEGMLPYMHKILDAKKEFLGEDQFMKEITEVEAQRQEMDKAASSIGEQNGITPSN